MFEICYGHQNLVGFKVMLFISIKIRFPKGFRLTQENEMLDFLSQEHRLCQENLSPHQFFHGLEAGVCPWTLSGIFAPREVSVCLEFHSWKGLCIFLTFFLFLFPNPTFVSPKTFNIPGHSVNTSFWWSLPWDILISGFLRTSLNPQIPL